MKLAMFCGDFMSQNSWLNVHKRYVNKNTSSVIKFTHSLSFCQQNIAKSNGHFNKVDGDLSKHQQGFAIQFIQPRVSTGKWAQATSPAGCNQLLSPSFLSHAMEIRFHSFMHIHKSSTTGNVDGFYSRCIYKEVHTILFLVCLISFALCFFYMYDLLKKEHIYNWCIHLSSG